MSSPLQYHDLRRERFEALGHEAGVVHECVFGVLALESEPVDPRL